MTALPTRLLASIASGLPETDPRLSVFEDSNQKQAREADERMRWETEMAASDPDIQKIVNDWRKP